MVTTRTDKQCSAHWANISTNGNKGKWTTEEDEKLAEAVNKHGEDWVAVAAMVPGRTNTQCRVRCKTVDPANVKKGVKWLTEEDAELMEAAQKHGKQWVTVAAMFPGRTNGQCRQRWVTNLASKGTTPVMTKRLTRYRYD
jgi:Myb-like DNA-binding protein BAS1